MGHSYGSILSYALVQDHPTGLSDGIVLTGFGQNSGNDSTYFTYGGNFVLARNASMSLSSYPAGYMASGDRTGVQTNFFAPDNFDPAVLQATYVTTQPVTVGELMTLGSGAVGNNTFGGPVLVITGGKMQLFSPIYSRSIPYEKNPSLSQVLTTYDRVPDRDIPFCGGNCNSTKPAIPYQSKQYFTNANSFDAVVVPNSGHGLNLVSTRH